jgi:predicted PhzF superfamily epimerase YddE/YHI9
MHRYRLVNVFVEDAAFSGNALAVFEEGAALDDPAMQAIALQLNLSETTFIFPSAVATARVRIFTPAFEMPFAGHPTLGTAHVVRGLRSSGDTVTPEMRAGIIPVQAQGDVWTLQAKPPKARAAQASHAELATMLGIGERELRGEGEGQVAARFFFLKHGALVEDPGTGSACANLGGWHVVTGAKLPIELAVQQGEHTGRKCRLGLRVDGESRIFVTGRVVEIGSGEIVV